jgi:hypothetical protein
MMNQTLIKIAWGKSNERVLWKGKKRIGRTKETPGMLEDVRALQGIVGNDKKGNQTMQKEKFRHGELNPGLVGTA